MTCPRADEVLAAVHCGERAEPHCAECREAMIREQRFVAMVEEGLQAIRPMSPIVPWVRERLPAARRPTRRAAPPRSLALPLAAAAAVLLAVAAIVLATRGGRSPAPVEREARKPERAAERREAPADRGTPLRPGESETARPRTDGRPPSPDEDATAKAPHIERDPDFVPERRTLPDERAEVAFTIRHGTLAVGTARLRPGRAALKTGEEFRAENLSRLDVPGGVIHLAAGARARFEAGAGVRFALLEKEAMVDAEAGAAIELRLAVPVRSATRSGRFVAIARPDCVFVQEGAARAGDEILGEGTEHRLAEGKRPAPQSPTLRGRWNAQRPRETTVWSESFHEGKRPPKVKLDGALVQGAYRTVRFGREGYYGTAGIEHEECRLFAASATTCVRFRYLLRKPARLVFQAFDFTQRENFEIEIAEPVAGHWTTVTLRVADLPPNPGGRRDLTVAGGDVFESIRWYVGRTDEESELLVDDVEILEIRR